MMWLMWLGLALILGAAEFFTLTLGFILLAAAAVASSVVAGAGGGLLLQLTTFAVTGGVGLIAVRPIARRHMSLPPPTRDGSDALVGRSALVTREVDADHGLIHLGGEDWSARPYDEFLVIPVGTRVDVLEIDGATALVHPREALL